MRTALIIVGIALTIVTQSSAVSLDKTFKDAYVKTRGDTLIVGTGIVERRWRMTEQGLKTIGLTDLRSDREWGRADDSSLCDWSVAGLGEGTLVALTAEESDDDGFCATHIETRATYQYGDTALTYVIWVYPGANGLRTTIELSNYPAARKAALGDTIPQPRTDRLAFAAPFSSATAFGLMQGFKIITPGEIMKETTLPWQNAEIDWANGLVLSGDGGGVVLVKEANKHLRSNGLQRRLTGAFQIDGNAVAMTGAGIDLSTLGEKPFTCWAHWIILYQGDAAHARLALKQFDRTRFPVNPDRDVFIMSNTWGSEDLRDECLYAAREENVLREIEIAADLGVDVLQIDDGWQTAEWLPAATAESVDKKGRIVEKFGKYPVYPNGWKAVREKADALGMKLGLWFAWTVPVNRMKESYDQGHFKNYKLDFAHLMDKTAVDGLLGKARAITKYSDYTAQITWDLTEIPPRMGFFYGREAANIYPANRKTITERKRVQYFPSEVLRNAWMLAKYANLNQFQISIGNIDFVPKVNPSPRIIGYNHPYVVGLSLMSSPLFFSETRHYSESARKQIKSVITPYKKHRQEMYTGYVCPIGDQPNDASWTGFQNVIPNSQIGYLTIFREMNNKEPSHRFRLQFIKDTEVELTDLVTGNMHRAHVGADGGLTLSIDQPAGFRFYRMKISEK